MGLKAAIEAVRAEDAGRLDAEKSRIEDACSKADGVVEVEVPHDLAGELCAWVEAEGARCAIVRGMERKTQLVINLGLAPVPEPENA